MNQTLEEPTGIGKFRDDHDHDVHLRAGVFVLSCVVCEAERISQGVTECEHGIPYLGPCEKCEEECPILLNCRACVEEEAEDHDH